MFPRGEKCWANQSVLFIGESIRRATVEVGSQENVQLLQFSDSDSGTNVKPVGVFFVCCFF